MRSSAAVRARPLAEGCGEHCTDALPVEVKPTCISDAEYARGFSFFLVHGVLLRLEVQLAGYITRIVGAFAKAVCDLWLDGPSCSRDGFGGGCFLGNKGAATNVSRVVSNPSRRSCSGVGGCPPELVEQFPSATFGETAGTVRTHRGQS
jgi:hypothetical protein